MDSFLLLLFVGFFKFTVSPTSDEFISYLNSSKPLASLSPSNFYSVPSYSKANIAF